MARTTTQKITANTKTEITTGYHHYDSLSLTNVKSSGTVTISLWITSQVGSSITDTGTNSNESDNAATTSSVTLTVDGTAATADVFENEKVWKSDGTLFGTCTARNSNTEIVFGGGVEQILANNDDLYVGTRYYILSNVIIPNGSTLVLDNSDFEFDSRLYNLYIISDSSDGDIDVIIRKF